MDQHVALGSLLFTRYVLEKSFMNAKYRSQEVNIPFSQAAISR